MFIEAEKLPNLENYCTNRDEKSQQRGVDPTQHSILKLKTRRWKGESETINDKPSITTDQQMKIKTG